MVPPSRPPVPGKYCKVSKPCPCEWSVIAATHWPVARFLQQHPQVAWVNYPGLPDHPQADLVQRLMRSFDGLPGASGLLSFGIRGGFERAVTFIESAQFMSHLANIGDTRTLMIHPASTTHRQLEPEQQAAAGVTPDLIRLSVGLEHVDDILWDIDQALHKAAR